MKAFVQSTKNHKTSN